MHVHACCHVMWYLSGIGAWERGCTLAWGWELVMYSTLRPEKKILLAIGDVNDSWGGYVRGYSRTHTDLSECLQRQERGLLSKVCEPAYVGGGGGGGGGGEIRRTITWQYYMYMYTADLESICWTLQVSSTGMMLFWKTHAELCTQQWEIYLGIPYPRSQTSPPFFFFCVKKWDWSLGTRLHTCMGVTSHVQYIAARKKILLATDDVNDSWGGYVRGYSRTHTDLSACLQCQEITLFIVQSWRACVRGGEKSDVLSHDNITCRLQSLHM